MNDFSIYSFIGEAPSRLSCMFLIPLVIMNIRYLPYSERQSSSALSTRNDFSASLSVYSAASADGSTFSPNLFANSSNRLMRSSFLPIPPRSSSLHSPSFISLYVSVTSSVGSMPYFMSASVSASCSERLKSSNVSSASKRRYLYFISFETSLLRLC